MRVIRRLNYSKSLERGIRVLSRGSARLGSGHLESMKQPPGIRCHVRTVSVFSRMLGGVMKATACDSTGAVAAIYIQCDCIKR